MRFFFYLFLSFLLAPPVSADIRFLSIADIHYGSENGIGDGKNTGDVLLSSALDKFSHLAKKVDFILVLGDLPTHMLWVSPKKETYIKKVFHDLYEADRANKPMFFISGNNDSLNGNYQPFSWQGKTPLSLAPDWQGACVHCQGLIINDKHMRDKGYYSSYVLPDNKDIILIVLNGTQFSILPYIIPPYPNQEKDAQQQLHWLKMQLKNHHAKQLLIAVHEPPGDNYRGSPLWHTANLKEFIQLLNQYHGNYKQISLLTGHTHMDDIRKIHLTDGQNIYAYATPSISEIHHTNPGMKIFKLDNNVRIKDYTTYYTVKEKQWGALHYHAIKGPDSLFPQCQKQFLAQCLDTFDTREVCQAFKKGKFYGVKSRRVDNTVCKLTYPVNH